MRLLDGKKIRGEILAEIAAGVAELDRPPRLRVIQVGEDAASSVYIRNKMRACKKTGIVGEHVHLDPGIDQEQLNRSLHEASASDADGVILQLPLPNHLDENEAMARLDPRKDADGFHPLNLGRLMAGLPAPRPCTPAGIRELLLREGVESAGQDVVILGRSLIVGKPAALLFLEKSAFGNATVTVCHSASRDIAAHTRRADILIAAVGRAHFVTADMIKEGAVVVDVGMNSIADPASERGTRLVGDCDFEAIKDKAAAITPVPGGVGPLTVAMLLKNTFEAAQRRALDSAEV
jgi:methylenetetrahydrofolate dehydrogenase (NADP+)/methenyltetrahydrofolate cyclohydrolase